MKFFITALKGSAIQRPMLNLMTLPDDTTKFVWQGEIRPIIDKIIDNWYFAFNPNIDFVLTGDNKGVGIAPQFKTAYNDKRKSRSWRSTEDFFLGLPKIPIREF